MRDVSACSSRPGRCGSRRSRRAPRPRRSRRNRTVVRARPRERSTVRTAGRQNPPANDHDRDASGTRLARCGQHQPGAGPEGQRQECRTNGAIEGAPQACCSCGYVSGFPAGTRAVRGRPCWDRAPGRAETGALAVASVRPGSTAAPGHASPELATAVREVAGRVVRWDRPTGWRARNDQVAALRLAEAPDVESGEDRLGCRPQRSRGIDRHARVKRVLVVGTSVRPPPRTACRARSGSSRRARGRVFVVGFGRLRYSTLQDRRSRSRVADDAVRRERVAFRRVVVTSEAARSSGIAVDRVRRRLPARALLIWQMAGCRVNSLCHLAQSYMNRPGISSFVVERVGLPGAGGRCCWFGRIRSATRRAATAHRHTLPPWRR